MRTAFSGTPCGSGGTFPQNESTDAFQNQCAFHGRVQGGSHTILPSQLSGRISSYSSGTLNPQRSRRASALSSSAGCKSDESRENHSAPPGSPLYDKYYWYISYLWFTERQTSLLSAFSPVHASPITLLNVNISFSRY